MINFGHLWVKVSMGNGEWELKEGKGGGVNDGTRTHDDRIHNPGLYQLSYVHHFMTCYVRPAGFEPATLSFVN
jgi:hypothetical protein